MMIRIANLVFRICFNKMISLKKLTIRFDIIRMNVHKIGNPVFILKN